MPRASTRAVSRNDNTLTPQTIKLLICCPDQKGIIAVVAGFVSRHGGNILEADQHTDPRHGEFFMRVEIEPDGFDLNQDSFAAAWAEVGRRYEMRWRICWGDTVKRMAVLVTR